MIKPNIDCLKRVQISSQKYYNKTFLFFLRILALLSRVLVRRLDGYLDPLTYAEELKNDKLIGNNRTLFITFAKLINRKSFTSWRNTIKLKTLEHIDLTHIVPSENLTQ